MRRLLRCGSFVAMSTDPTPLRTLRARKRADHLIDLRDEIASALTHGLGALLALAGSAVLITLAAIHGDGWQLGASIVFGVTLLLLYTASTLYHAIQHPVAKGRLKVFDHCAIYLLIAGTYTPFTLIGLRGPWGWGLFIAIWTLAFAGVVFKLFYTGRFKLLSTIIYIAMGWLVVVAIKPLLTSVDLVTLGWMLAGGLFYTLGTFFYHRESIRYSHAIWHLFVIGGSVCHFVAVTQQVLSPRLA
jgi:hemolysin III